MHEQDGRPEQDEGMSGRGLAQELQQLSDLPEAGEVLQIDRESLTVTYLNTSFGGALEHLDSLLRENDSPRENTILALSEVVSSQRGSLHQLFESRGYFDQGFTLVLPSEDSHLDLAYVIGPGLHVDSSDEHHFPRTGLRRVASRPGSDNYRHVGVHDLTVSTQGGNRIRLGNERLSPWIVEPVRRLQLRDLGNVLAEHYPPSDDAVLTLNGGDMNHIKPFRGPDNRMWDMLNEQEGWKPMLEPGTPTHNSSEKYARSGRVFKAMGRKSDETQLDAIYARPRQGDALVNQAEGEAGLELNQIGYSTKTTLVQGTDHYAVETTFSLATSQSEALPT